MKQSLLTYLLTGINHCIARGANTVRYIILAALILGSMNVWGQASVGTTLWGENFEHFGTKTPSAAGIGSGTTIYGSASITYAQSSTSTKAYAAKLAGGTSPELLLAKNNGTWTISGIPTGGATEITLTFLSNKTAFDLTSSTTGITISGSQTSWTISATATVTTFDLTLKNTSSGDNARIDNVQLVVKTAGGPVEERTITWSVNEHETTSTVTDGEKPVYNGGTDPTTFNCDGTKVFVGWTTAPVTDGNKPSTLLATADLPTVSADEKYYAVFANAAGGNGSGGAETWSKAEIGDITATDEVVITMMNNNGEYYAMSNNNGTSNPPTATSVTVSSDKLTLPTTNPDYYKWNIAKDGDNLTIYPNGTTEKWLYCTSTNNGVRVGTNTDKIFTIDATSGYLKHTKTSRYVGVYNSADWRCYTNTTGNTANQTLTFFKKGSGTSYSGYVTSCSGGSSPICTPLATPTIIEPATEITSSSVKLSWNSVANASSYQLRYVKLESGSPLEGPNVENVTSYTLKGLDPETNYIWTVQAIGDGTNYCNSEESSVGDFTTEAATVVNTEWVLVTDASTLAAGDEVVIASNAKGMTATDIASSVMKNVASTFSDDLSTITELGEGTVIFTLGGSADAWTLTNPSNQLLGATAVKKLAWGSGTTTWSISITDGDATIQNGTSTYGRFLYNSTTNQERFTTYTSGTSTSMLLPQLYRKEVAGPAHTITTAVPGGNGTITAPATAEETRTVTITANPADGYTFAGWTIVNTDGTTEGVPTLSSAFTPTATFTMGTKDVTVTAKFVEGTYHLVTSDMPALTAGDELLIASYWEKSSPNRHVLAGAIGTDKRMSVVDAAFSADKKTVTCLPAGYTLFMLGEETDAYTLRSTSGYLTAPSTTTNDLEWNTNAALWTIDVDETGLATIKSNSRILVGNLATTAGYFIASKDGPTTMQTACPVQLYRKYDICGLEVKSTKLKYTKDGTVNKDDLTIWAIYTDGSKSEEALTDEEKKYKVDLDYDFSEIGKAEVVATYTATNGRTVTGSYTVDVENLSKIIFNMYGTPLVEYKALSGTTLTTEQIADAETAAQNTVCSEPVNYTFVGWSDKQGEVNEVAVTTSTDFIESGRTFYAIYSYSEGGITTLVDDDMSTEANWTSTGYVSWNTNDVRLGSGSSDGTISRVLSVTAGSTVTVTFKAKKYNNDTPNLTVKLGNTTVVSNSQLGADYAEYTCTATAPTDNPTLSFTALKDKRAYIDHIFVTAGTVSTTTQPLCGPYLQITGKTETWLTGGVGVGGIRSTVTTKVAFVGDRLEGSGDNAPSVYVSASDISSTTIKVETNDIVQTATKNADGTYKIEGTALVKYTPMVANTSEDVTIIFTVKYNTGEANAKPTYTVHTRALPAQFVIAAKHEGNWYALPGDMDGASTHDAIAIEVNAEGTAATQARNTAIYTFDGVPNTGDRQYVRFIGSKSGGYLWASTSDGTGIQNNVLSQMPASTNTPYNWLLTTTDNQTYTISNGKHIELTSGRQLGYHKTEGKFGNYKTGASYDLKILPVEDICTYFDAPTGLAVTGKTSTTLSLSWDAVAGAAGYEYSTDNGTTWTEVANPELTLTGLTASAEYTVWVRATAGTAATNCSEAGSITVQLPDCDNVPTHVIAEATSASVTVSWAEGGTGAAKVVIYTDKTCSTEVTSAENVTEKYVTLSGLTAKTVYYVVVYGNGTCASDAVPFQTESPYIDVVEWGEYEGADNEGKYTSGVTLNLSDPDAEAVISVGSETIVTNGSSNTEATDLFFSKYYESIGNLKLIAIYNGTKNDISVSGMRITVGAADKDGVTESEPSTYNTASCLTVKTAGPNCILLDALGLPDNKIKAGQEIVIYTWNGTAGNAAGTDEDGNPIDIEACAADAISNQFGEIDEATKKGFEREGWYNLERGEGTSTAYVKYGIGYCNWSGRQAIALMRDEEMIDVIGSYHRGANPTTEPYAKYYAGDGIVSSTGGDAEGWIGTGPQFDLTTMSISNKMVTLSTNRNLLVRLNTTTSGANAVAKNKDGDFETLSEEWTGLQLGSTDDWSLVCKYFPAVAAFNYTQYYVTYETVMEEQTLSGMKNEDGTFTVPLDIDNLSCKRIKIETKKGGQILLSTEVRVPIIVDKTQNTHEGDAFTALTNIHEGKTAAEICQTCDVVVKNDAVLTHADNAIPQIGNLTVQDGAKLKIADGKKLTVASVTLRSEKDVVPHLILPSDNSELESKAKSLRFTKRIKNDRYYFFSLPFDCNVEDIMLSNGEKAVYGTDILILYYDGAKRAADGSSLEGDNWIEINPAEPLVAGQGYALAVATANPTEVVFPMTLTSTALHVEDNNDKAVAITAHGFDADGNNISGRTPNNLGWNFVGHPYFTHYGTLADTDLKQGKIEVVDGVVGDTWVDETNLYVNIPNADTDQTYTQKTAATTTLSPFFPFFVQVGTDGWLEYAPDTRQPAAIAARKAASNDKPVFVGVSLSNGKMIDETSLVINDRFTQAYEVGFDLEKLLGLGQKPQLYVTDNAYRYAFKALSENDAAATNTIGVYLPAKEATTYTFDVMRGYDLSRVQGVYLTDHVAGTMTNLLQSKYTFTTGYAYTNNRFSLSVVLAPKAVTSLTNTEIGWSVWQDAPQHIRIQGLSVGDDVRVVDATGKLIEHVTATDTAAQFSLPAAGAYCVQVIGVNGLDVRKVVVR